MEAEASLLAGWLAGPGKTKKGQMGDGKKTRRKISELIIKINVPCINIDDS